MYTLFLVSGHAKIVFVYGRVLLGLLQNILLSNKRKMTTFNSN